MAETDAENTTQPDPLFDAIGRVIAEAASMEQAFTRLVSDMAGVGTPVFFTRGVLPSQLYGPAKALIENEHIPEPWRSHCADMTAAVKRLLEDRNQVAHGTWLTLTNVDGSFASYSSTKPVRHSISGKDRLWSLADLHELAREMADATGRMFVLSHNLMVLVSGSSAKLMDWPEDGWTIVGMYAPRPPSFGYRDSSE